MPARTSWVPQGFVREPANQEEADV